MTIVDRRLEPATWKPEQPSSRRLVRLAAVLVNLLLGVWYLGWLLRPERVGNPVLFAVLCVAELYNAIQAIGFWWTSWSDRRAPNAPRWPGERPAVDVLIPVYNEPVDVVEATVAAAARLRGADVRVTLCDDGSSDDMAALAARHGIGYLRRPDNQGAKAGNLNHAIDRTDGQFIAVFDCDHVPDRPSSWRPPSATSPRRWRGLRADAAVLRQQGRLADRRARPAPSSSSSSASSPGARQRHGLDVLLWHQRGVPAHCPRLEVGGFPEDSLTEDFALSVRLHEAGWKSEYVPEVLASGLGPEDMASYVSQQRRWAQGCLTGIPVVLRSKLPWRQRAQYLSSATFFLSGWTLLVYMALPAIRLAFGVQPIAGVSSNEFLLHFVPYFVACISTVVVASGGAYTFAAFALTAATYGAHLRSLLLSVLGRHGRFVVTPKRGTAGRQVRPVSAAVAAVAVLVLAIVVGVLRSPDPGTLNNAAYGLIHVAVLLSGAWPALARPRVEATETTERFELEPAAA